VNKKRRMKNRETARQLARDTAPPCPKCGQKGPHWFGVPMTLADLMSGTEPEGFGCATSSMGRTESACRITTLMWK